MLKILHTSLFRKNIDINNQKLYFKCNRNKVNGWCSQMYCTVFQYTCFQPHINIHYFSPEANDL